MQQYSKNTRAENRVVQHSRQMRDLRKEEEEEEVYEADPILYIPHAANNPGKAQGCMLADRARNNRKTGSSRRQGALCQTSQAL